MRFRNCISTILFFSVVLFLSACGEQPEVQRNDLHQKADFLTEAEALALADADPKPFIELAGHLGSDRLVQLSSEFLDIAFADTLTSSLDRQSLMEPYERVTAALADLNLCPEYRSEMLFFQNLDLEEARLVLAKAREQKRVFSSRELAPNDRTEQLTALHEELIEAGYDLAVSAGWNYRGTLATRTGQPALARKMFTAWLDHAREKNLRTAQCSALASLIMQGFAEGNTDSTSVLLDRGLKLARSSRLASQTGRLLALTGYRDFSLGHYSAAVRSFEESVAACRNFGSPARGLSHLGTLMRMYAVMESWTLVDQVSQRAKIMLTEAEELGGSGFTTNLQAIRLDEIQARSLMARGQVDESHAAYSELWDRIMEQPFEEASFLANFWIMGLLDHGRPELAATALARAEPYAKEAGIRHMVERIPFWKARTFFQQGQIDSALVFLNQFADEGLPHLQWSRDLQIPYFALRVRLLAENEKSSAESVLAEGLAALADRLADNDAGAGAFLDLSRARGLRWAAHDVFGTEAEVGYGLELMWRRYLSMMGEGREQPFTPQTEVVAEARQAATEAAKRLDGLNAVHLLYQVREPRIIRWTLGRGTAVRDTLSVPAGDLRKIVGAAQRAMSTDPGDRDLPIDAPLADRLRDLAHLLLPEFLLESEFTENEPLLLISGEGFLSQIPFAPLHIGPAGDYVPLAARVNLSWVRDPALAPLPVAGEGSLLISCPNIDPVLTRRHRALGPLAGADDEVDAVQTVCQGEFLTADTATKQEVFSAWSNVSMIYFLGHVLHNPEVPFLTTIPLTPPSGPHLPVEAALDIADIRSADLDHCRLAVLSGCGSGAPFADGVITAPSLGDAFLDAGAEASLQTFWRIRDENPVFAPEDVVRLWKQEGLSLPEALTAVRREAMSGPNGIRHPFGWGAWSLKTAGMPR